MDRREEPPRGLNTRGRPHTPGLGGRVQYTSWRARRRPGQFVPRRPSAEQQERHSGTAGSCRKSQPWRRHLKTQPARPGCGGLHPDQPRSPGRVAGGPWHRRTRRAFHRRCAGRTGHRSAGAANAMSVRASTILPRLASAKAMTAHASGLSGLLPASRRSRLGHLGGVQIDQPTDVHLLESDVRRIQRQARGVRRDSLIRVCVSWTARMADPMLVIGSAAAVAGCNSEDASAAYGPALFGSIACADVETPLHPTLRPERAREVSQSFKRRRSRFKIDMFNTS